MADISNMFQKSTNQFSVALDFNEMLSYGLDPEGSVRREVMKGYIGKNFQGYHLVELVSINDIGKPMINTNVLNITVKVQFTANCIRLIENRIIRTPIVQSINDKRAIIGAMNLGEGESILYINYNCKMAEMFIGKYFPAIITELTYPLYTSRIIAKGDLLLAYNKPVFYRHDGSKGTNFPVVKETPENNDAKQVYEKLAPIYTMRGVDKITGIRSTNNYDTGSETLFALFSPLGPIYHVEKNVSILDYNNSYNSALITNMYEIEARTFDAHNCIVTLSNLYAVPGKVNEEKIKAYASVVRGLSIQKSSQ